ncbi:uncharacterized protein TNCT_83211 [Trichonephila clavata]|uniref:Uncharacterized protein n=1 Tax=Trichonephila clavata TaxID=2740835 RepID=A0A8X6K266_TRICU|nr:uncharacterized protein TNCT_83211 [Trichonephila clavata]
MDLLFNIKYPEKISPLLTLTKILKSPDELIYVTKMRNLILFQISSADYQYLEYKFKHDFTFDVEKDHCYLYVLTTHFLMLHNSGFWCTILNLSVTGS